MILRFGSNKYSDKKIIRIACSGREDVLLAWDSELGQIETLR